jgi:hypothetical protein
MPITIKGIRVDSLTIEKKEDGSEVTTAQYSLISSEDRVLAKQAIGGYNGMTIAPSPDTTKALVAFMRSYSSDVEKLLGLDGA